MNLLLIDPQELGLAFALYAQDRGHEVKLWIPKSTTGEECPVGAGLVSRPAAWQPYMKWADLIVVTANDKYAAELEPFYKAGLPILGTNSAAAQLELDREKGQKALEACGIETAAFEVLPDCASALEKVKREGGAFVVKPWGGTQDKSLSFVPPKGYEEEGLIFHLEKCKARGLKGPLMLQEKVDGIEMGVSGWFGPGGWSEAIEEDFEDKKFLSGGWGCNTGEQGTTLRFVKESKLFNAVLAPLSEYLHALNFVGNLNVNCIIDAKGKPWPLEFTARLGWPAFNIMLPLVEGDLVETFAGLLGGSTAFPMKSKIAVGVVMSHGDYPWSKQSRESNCGYPIWGLREADRDNVHFQHVARGKGKNLWVTAGDYVAAVTGIGSTVRAAHRGAMELTERLTWPSNVQVRDDIGRRLKKQLPVLQAKGFAEGMEY